MSSVQRGSAVFDRINGGTSVIEQLRYIHRLDLSYTEYAQDALGTMRELEGWEYTEQDVDDLAAFMEANELPPDAISDLEGG